MKELALTLNIKINATVNMVYRIFVLFYLLARDKLSLLTTPRAGADNVMLYIREP